MIRQVAIALCALTSGCASFIQGISDRGVMSDHMVKDHDFSKIKSMNGDRRNTYIFKRPAQAGTVGPVICEAPLPGAMIARGSKSTLAVTGTGDFGDQLTGQALAVDARNSTVRGYQDIRHDLCMRYQDGTLDPVTYIKLLTGVNASEMQALATPTPSPSPSPSAPSK